MNRRGVMAIPFLGALFGLAGCGKSETANVRFRVICTVEVNGRKVEGTTVMEVHYTMVTSSLTGMGASSRHIGEALILDLPGRGTVYMLPYKHNGHGLDQVFPQGIITSIGIDKGIGAINVEDYAKLRAAKGRMRFTVDGKAELKLPAFVAFRNEKDPKTIYEIDPLQFGRFFPGVKFINLEIEFTDAPLTRELLKRLPWLEAPTGTQVFPRDPNGQMRPARDLPISYKINRSNFFGLGN
ncbi:MAG: hypothetical protein CFE31_18970 [Rhizobiales bacterium PAR1]|nr:MAG: hypothetical protein CFE31_18970 [Rhizobiales bacterium PAR1]